MEQAERKRKIDSIAEETYSWWGKSIVFIKKTEIKTWKGVFILAFAAGAAVAIIWTVTLNWEDLTRAQEVSRLVEQMKVKGCVADGLLSGYGGDTDNAIKLMDRSECVYLHRAVETWLAPPDFEVIKNNLEKFQRKDYIIGMFLAEAINKKAVYYFPDEKRNFDFSAMCRQSNDSEDYWGTDTCKPSFNSKEYRKYLEYITKKAIDLNIQSFLIGQIYFQDNVLSEKSYASEFIKKMHKYAESEGKEIVIGAQTNNIENEKFLRLFDYIEGGVGIDNQGNVEAGPCFSGRPGCWALLWNEKYAFKANNVLLHLDWSGFVDDDMSIFAKMNKATREKTLRNLYTSFTGKNMGFLMPFLAVINKDINGCYGPTKEFYSPDNLYTCKDEDVINSILKTKTRLNNAKFISQTVPTNMVAGKTYPVSVTLKNTGRVEWTMNNLYRLGSQNPQDNDLWGGRITLSPGEMVLPGENKIFMFNVTAPEEPGEYEFQWQMVQEHVEWFGDFTQNIKITVTSEGKPLPAKIEETSLPVREVPGGLPATPTIPVENNLP